jgi:hypothetical protein
MAGRSDGITVKVSTMPQVTVRTTFNDCEESLTEYLCDWPDCPNVAVHIVGFVRELRIRTAMCDEHAAHWASPPKGL